MWRTAPLATSGTHPKKMLLISAPSEQHKRQIGKVRADANFPERITRPRRLLISRPFFSSFWAHVVPESDAKSGGDPPAPADFARNEEPAGLPPAARKGL